MVDNDTQHSQTDQPLSSADEARYRLLMENAQEGIVVLDDIGRYVDFNPPACKLLGYSREELLERGLINITKDVSPEVRQERFVKLIEQGVWIGEYQVEHKDGRLLELSFYTVANYVPGRHIVLMKDVTEEKRALLALQESESRYRSLFEYSREGIVLFDDEHQIIDLNPRLSQLTGYTKEELLEKGVDFLASPHLDYLTDKYWQMLQKDGLLSSSYQLIHRDGHVLHIEFYAVANITPGQHLAVVHDNTERKEAELALIESEQRYSDLVDSTPSSLLVIQDGKYVFANFAAARIMGYDRPEDMIGVKMLDTVSERYREMIQNRIKKAVAGTENEPVLMEILQPSGKIRKINSTSIPYTYDGKPAALVIGIDVTDQEKYKSRLDEFFRIAPIGSLILKERTFIEVNEVFCKMLGYSAGELLGNNTRMLYLNDEEYETVGKTLYPLMEYTGMGMVESRVVKKDGEVIHVLISSALLEPEDRSEGVIITVLDISDRKEVENTLQRINEELEERVARRTEQLQQKMMELESFSYSISHDLRAPVRAVNGFSQILRDEYAKDWDEDAKELLERVVVASKKMDTLIDGLLSLSRLGQQSMKLQPLDLSKIAQKVYADLTRDLNDRVIEISFEEGPKIWADQEFMEVVFTNLLSNAIKYTRERDKAVLHFGCRKDENPPVFYLQDNGIGFDESQKDQLFTPFQRLVYDPSYSGAGIGLTIVKQIIDRHNGQLWAESEQGKGATFYFTLNILPDDLAKAEKQRVL